MATSRLNIRDRDIRMDKWNGETLAAFMEKAGRQHECVEHAMRNVLLGLGVACAMMATLIVVNSAVGLPCHLRTVCDR
jgi:hypothetical protein